MENDFFPDGSGKNQILGKESACMDSDHWEGKIPWRRKWQPTPVILPGRSHGQGSPWGRKNQTQLSN